MSKDNTPRYNFALIATDGTNTCQVSAKLEFVINTMKSVLYDYVREVHVFDSEDYEKWIADVHHRLLISNGHATLRFGRVEVFLTLCEYQLKY
jgi:hypothetical protein